VTLTAILHQGLFITTFGSNSLYHVVLFVAIISKAKFQIV